MQKICAQCTAFTVANSISPMSVWAHNITPLKNPGAAASVLHVYLENDGAPYLSPQHIAANPSLRQSFFALKLMQQDRAPSLYISRPCYGFAHDALPQTCTAKYWTTARYSQEIVDALSQALDVGKQQVNLAERKIVLIGHSGGGALAMLLAGQRADVTGVITLAGNLHIDAWTQLHGYHPLTESINPFHQARLPAQIKRWHFAGTDDRNIPPHLLALTCQRDRDAECKTLDKVAHEFGWLGHWPGILNMLKIE